MRVKRQFRSSFLDKNSPIHFFWGSFDLASSRFSGRRAPERPGTDALTREGYSHEVISCGFWPGNEALTDPVFMHTRHPNRLALKRPPFIPVPHFTAPIWASMYCALPGSTQFSPTRTGLARLLSEHI